MFVILIDHKIVTIKQELLFFVIITNLFVNVMQEFMNVLWLIVEKDAFVMAGWD